MSIIRFASTVILLRKIRKSDIQVYTIKRPDTMKFLPGFTAFPGGAVEEEDMVEGWQQVIKQEVRKYPLLPERSIDSPAPISDQSMQNLEIGYVVAAIREVFEETGVLICQAGPQYLTPEYLSAYRQALEKNEATFFDIIKSLQIKLDTRYLLHIGRRLTPPERPIRFNTNFYVTFVPNDIELVPSANEVASDAWIDPFQAEEMWVNQKIFCVTPTKECFRLLADRSHQKLLLQMLA